MQRREFRAMGSKMLAIVEGEDSSALDQVPGWFEESEQVLSRFRIDSELTLLNAAAGTAQRVSQTLLDVFRVACAAEQLTGGLVNALILEDLVGAGYDRPFDILEKDLPSPFAAGTGGSWISLDPQELPALNSVLVDEAEHTLFLPFGTGLDFGGVAKGWAAHQAMLRLRHLGPALVSAGGDVAISGPLLNGEPWRIEVEDPFNDGAFIEMLYIETGGVATSGKDHRHWRRGGVLQHHIIDPRTRRPAETDIMAATVVARDVMRAEAIAKAVLISGSQAGLSMLNAFDDAEGLLVLDDGSELFSRNIEMYL